MRNVTRGRSREPTGQQLESGVNPWWGLGLMCVWWNVMVLVSKRKDSLLLQPMRLVDEHTFIYLLDFVQGRRWKDGVKEKGRRKRRKEPLYFYPSFFSRSVLIEERMEEKTQRGKGKEEEKNISKEAEDEERLGKRGTEIKLLADSGPRVNHTNRIFTHFSLPPFNRNHFSSCLFFLANV